MRKLVHKERLGAKLRKRYDAAQTPCQRVLAAGVLTPAQRQALARELAAINPADLARRINNALDKLWSLTDHERPRTQRNAG